MNCPVDCFCIQPSLVPRAVASASSELVRSAGPWSQSPPTESLCEAHVCLPLEPTSLIFFSYHWREKWQERIEDKSPWSLLSLNRTCGLSVCLSFSLPSWSLSFCPSLLPSCPHSASPVQLSRYPTALSELIFLTHLGRLVITLLSRNSFHFIIPGEKY